MEPHYVEQFLKPAPGGPDAVAALWRRLDIHLKDPKTDNLSRRVWGAYNALLGHLREPFTFLDVGCMSGFMYHFLLRYFAEFAYTGVDRWAAALEVARAAAPDAAFIDSDLFSLDLQPESFDYVWCSNLPWRNDQARQAIQILEPLARKAFFFVVTPGNGNPGPHLKHAGRIDCGESDMYVVRK